MYGDFFGPKGEAKAGPCDDADLDFGESCHDSFITRRDLQFPSYSLTKRRTYCCLRYEEHNCYAGETLIYQHRHHRNNVRETKGRSCCVA